MNPVRPEPFGYAQGAGYAQETKLMLREPGFAQESPVEGLKGIYVAYQRLSVKKPAHASTGLSTNGFLHVQLIFLG